MSRKKKDILLGLRVASVAPEDTNLPVSCWDNGGSTADRYTIIFTNQPEDQAKATFAAVGASDDVTSPQGFYQHTIAQPGRHLGKRIGFTQLPEALQKRVMEDLSDNDQPLGMGEMDPELEANERAFEGSSAHFSAKEPEWCDARKMEDGKQVECTKRHGHAPPCRFEPIPKKAAVNTDDRSVVMQEWEQTHSQPTTEELIEGYNDGIVDSTRVVEAILNDYADRLSDTGGEPDAEEFTTFVNANWREHIWPDLWKQLEQEVYRGLEQRYSKEGSNKTADGVSSEVAEAGVAIDGGMITMDSGAAPATTSMESLNKEGSVKDKQAGPIDTEAPEAAFATGKLRPFEKQDWWGWAGATKFPDGTEPLIGEVQVANWPELDEYGDDPTKPMPVATLIVDGAGVALNGVNGAYYKEIVDKEQAIAAANVLYQTQPLDVSNLAASGWEEVNMSSQAVPDRSGETDGTEDWNEKGRREQEHDKVGVLTEVEASGKTAVRTPSPLAPPTRAKSDFDYKKELTTEDGYEIQSGNLFGDPTRGRFYTVWPPEGNAVGTYGSVEEAKTAITQWKQFGQPELLKRDGGAQFKVHPV